MKPTVVLRFDIDWGVPQWVRHKEGTERIILTSGKHENEVFQGTMLPCPSNPEGSFATWHKKDFVPIENSLTIKISN